MFSSCVQEGPAGEILVSSWAQEVLSREIMVSSCVQEGPSGVIALKNEGFFSTPFLRPFWPFFIKILRKFAKFLDQKIEH